MIHTAQASQQRESKNKTASQQILIDWEGFIIESNDTIFSTFPHRHRPVMEWSSFIESIFPVLHTLELDSEEIVLTRIDSITNTATGLFDCSFMRVEWGDSPHVFVWNIFDSRLELPLLRQQQQRFNEIQIRMSH
jgi:hypothetical protein